MTQSDYAEALLRFYGRSRLPRLFNPNAIRGGFKHVCDASLVVAVVLAVEI